MQIISIKQAFIKFNQSSFIGAFILYLWHILHHLELNNNCLMRLFFLHFVVVRVISWVYLQSMITHDFK